ncbi:MAG TPA: hypothetical protein VG943_03365 [Caulobacterales bacterium]|nr:hypothetical protein [Caulobacterales bacterium]
MKTLLFALTGPLLLSSCLAGAAIGAAGAVAGAAVKTTGAVVGAAIPDGDDHHDKDKEQRR